MMTMFHSVGRRLIITTKRFNRQFDSFWKGGQHVRSASTKYYLFVIHKIENKSTNLI